MSTANEAETRRLLIDPALKKAGWDLANPNQIPFEIPVDDFDPVAWQTLKRRFKEAGVPYEVSLAAGVCDYALYRPDGDIIAIVEAKRTSTQPLLAHAQTEFYIAEIAKRQGFVPFAFMSSGYRTQFWDVGYANPRDVAGFFFPEDLANLLYIRQEQKPLAHEPINHSITDRPYQREAIQRLGVFI